MLKVFITIPILLAFNTFANETGTQTEKKTSNPTYGQEYFRYQPGMFTYTLKKRIDLKLIFIFTRKLWVYKRKMGLRRRLRV